MKMTLTKEENQIRQLQMCIDSSKMIVKREKDPYLKALFKAKIKDYKSKIKALESA